VSGAPSTGAEAGGGYQGWRLWAAIALVVIAAVFILQNSKEVSVDFLFWTIKAPLVFALLFCAVIGLLVGLLYGRRGGRAHTKS
jgi:uncharacterized integral membrane protein